MAKNVMNLQDSFLNQVRKDNAEITLILLDGTRLSGYVRGFDNFTVIVQVDSSQHLVYKHAIGHIIQRRPAARPPAEGESRQGEPARKNRPHPRGDKPASRPSSKKEDAAQEDDDQKKEKFNTLDFSNIKVE